MKLFLLGFAAGIAATLIAIGRGMGTPSRVCIEQEWRVPAETEYDGEAWVW